MVQLYEFLHNFTDAMHIQLLSESSSYLKFCVNPQGHHHSRAVTKLFQDGSHS
jgi:hypothetical protein